jgi:tetratricopeptide (TPR) repeat protein
MDQAAKDYADIDWMDIFTGFTRATDADPYNASAVLWRGIAYAWVGNLDAAIADWKRCRELDPYYAPCLENLHWYLADTGRDDEAREVLLNSMNLGASKAQYLNLPFLARSGNELLFKAVTNNVRFLRDWRHHDELYAALRNLDADHTELAVSIAEFYTANPERDKDAMEPLLLALGYPLMLDSLVGVWSSSGRKVRQTEQFKALIRSSGIHDYFKENGWPAGCRPVGEDDFECD